ncbi:MAG: AAA family ATPase [Verrucomicrobiaceae bacterium]|nr:AAA family ATPase [Verrucomicrobiaceae bacterium]
MLISFSVTNFRSFRDEQTLDMTASTRVGAGHDDHCCKIEGENIRLLPVAVLYGANGAGKSNLIKALRYAAWMVLDGPRPGKHTAREAFAHMEGPGASPSCFDFRIFAAGHIFRFGFQVSDSQIESEWLVLEQGGNEKMLYERSADASGKIDIKLGNLLADEAVADKSQIHAFAQFAKSSSRANQLFLHAIHENVGSDSQGEWVRPVLRWFSESLMIIDPGEHLKGLHRLLTTSPDFAAFSSSFLKSVSTGVDEIIRLRTEELPFEHARDMIPFGLAQGLAESDFERDTVADYTLPTGGMMAMTRGSDGGYFVHTIATKHHAGQEKPFELPLVAESDGTRRLLHLLPVIYPKLKSDSVIVIDEIDRSLHPLLTREFVEAFLKVALQTQRQLLLTTHDTILLDLDLLRRDEIWFVEKDQRSSSNLYPLSQFPVRKDLRLQRGYMQGRFGAIPFLGDLEKLHAGREAAA